MSSRNAYIRGAVGALVQRMTELAESTVSVPRSHEDYLTAVGRYREMKHQLAQLQSDLKSEPDDEPEELEAPEPDAPAPAPLQPRRRRHKPRGWGGG